MEHNILLVDDDPGLIRVMARMLSGLGQLRFATSGEAALQQASDCPPDLMILDAEMPGMSGFQVCEAMKSEPALRDVPIMFMTGHTDRDFEIKGLELGAVDFLPKPVNEPLVLARVKTQLRIKRLTDELRQAVTKDLVTHLPNRQSFEELLTREWARGLRAGSAISMLMVEVDHLDAYIERYGHQMADKGLRRVGQALQRLCVEPADLVARYDHSMFAMLLPATGRELGEQRAHQVISTVESMAIDHATSPTSRHVTLTVGVSTYDAPRRCWVASQGAGNSGECPSCSADDLVRCAQAALKAARCNGRAQAWWADTCAEADGVNPQEVSVKNPSVPQLAAA